MARLTVLAALVVTVAFVSGAFGDEGESPLDGYVKIPNVKIPWRLVPREFWTAENKFLDKCCVTKTYWNRSPDVLGLFEDDTPKFDKNHKAMKEILPIVEAINKISADFETAQNRGTYVNSESDLKAFDGFAAQLLKIDREQSASGDENYPGQFLAGVCEMTFRIMCYIEGAKNLRPGIPAPEQAAPGKAAPEKASPEKPAPEKPTPKKPTPEKPATKTPRVEDLIETVQTLMLLNKYTEAKEKITEILDNPAYTDKLSSETVSKLLLDRATANFQTKNYREAIEDATNAMKDNRLSHNDILQCLDVRAESYMAMRNFSSAINIYEERLKIEKSSEVELKLAEARRALQRSQSDNYYDILEVEKTAKTSEIRKAYLRLARIHHVDKHPTASQSEKEEQKEILRKIFKAYETLSDPEARKKYDIKLGI